VLLLFAGFIGPSVSKYAGFPLLLELLRLCLLLGLARGLERARLGLATRVTLPIIIIAFPLFRPEKQKGVTSRSFHFHWQPPSKVALSGIIPDAGPGQSDGGKPKTARYIMIVCGRKMKTLAVKPVPEPPAFPTVSALATLPGVGLNVKNG
jgi:hypothetical protein